MSVSGLTKQQRQVAGKKAFDARMAKQAARKREEPMLFSSEPQVRHAAKAKTKLPLTLAVAAAPAKEAVTVQVASNSSASGSSSWSLNPLSWWSGSSAAHEVPPAAQAPQENQKVDGPAAALASAEPAAPERSMLNPLYWIGW